MRISANLRAKVDEFDEENFNHITHIWTRGNQTMALDCGHLPNEPLIVDRLHFEKD